MKTLDSSRVAILEKFLELGRSRDMAAREAMVLAARGSGWRRLA